MTALTIINSAMRQIGAMASGETLTTTEQADGLEGLINLLAGWSADELLDFATRTASVTMVASTVTYAIPGARPVKILSADLVYSGINTPVEVCGPERWAALPDKQLSNPQPKFLYCDYAYTTPAIYVAQIPTATATMRLYCLVDLVAVAATGDTFDMPEGYARAISANLAVELYPQYPRPGGIDPALVQTAKDSKAELRRMTASNRAGKSQLELPPVSANTVS